MVTTRSLAPAGSVNPETQALFRWIEEQLSARRADYDFQRRCLEK
jgi:hypothetical protein